MDIDALMVRAGLFSCIGDDKEKMAKFSELLFVELKKMNLDEFKNCIRHKLTLEKKTREIVVELAFEIRNRHQVSSLATDKPSSVNS